MFHALGKIFANSLQIEFFSSFDYFRLDFKLVPSDLSSVSFLKLTYFFDH